MRSLLVLLFCVACSSAPLPAAVGVHEPGLHGHLDLTTVDSHGAPMPVDSATLLFNDGTGLTVSGRSSHFAFDDARVVGNVEIDVGSMAWVGVAGASVVIDVETPVEEEVDVRVRGLDPAVTDVRIEPLAPAALFGGALPATMPAPSHVDGADRVATLRRLRGQNEVAAVAVDAQGHALSILVSTLDDTLTIDASPEPTQTVNVTLPPPAGATQVVGVPGVSVGGSFAVLWQTPTALAAQVSMLVTTGTFWVIAQSGDASGRTVQMQRNLQSADGIVWASWLDMPGASVAAQMLTLQPVAGATVHAIEWLDASGAVGSRRTIFGPQAGAMMISVPSGASAVRVRALDAMIDPGNFDVADAEGSVRRFSETVASVTP